MNTLTTLFGGLAAVLLLYAAGGLIRGLPLMLRALLAGLIPLLVYLGMSVGHWPGLDVVAIHVSVFLAAALVLFALTRLRRGGRMHWAPRLLVLFFAGLVVINATLLYIATSGLPEPIGRWWLGGNGGPVYSGFSGTVAHGQGAARAVSSELSEAHRESRLGWQVEIDGFDASTRTLPLAIRVRDRTGLPVDDAQVRLGLTRPGAPAPAQRSVLARTDAGVYQGALILPGAGRWLIDIELMQHGVVRYRNTQEVNVP